MQWSFAGGALAAAERAFGSIMGRGNDDNGDPPMAALLVASVARR